MKERDIGVTVALVCAGVACGSSSSSNPGDGGAGTDAGMDSAMDSGPTTNEGGAGTEAGIDSATDSGSTIADGSTDAEGGAAAYTGFFEVNSEAANPRTYRLSAQFYPTATAPTPNVCPGTVVGDCCVFSPSGGDAGAAPMAAGAGTITVKDGASTISTMMPDAKSNYSDSSSTNAGLVWNGGDVVAISGSGDVVHAFSGQVTAVQDIAGVMPALSLTSPITLSLSADFVVSWTPGAGSGVEAMVALTASHGATKDVAIQCTGMDSAGKLTVPKSLLSSIPQSDSGLVGLARYASSTAVGDNVSVSIVSDTHAFGIAQFTP
jgi:hypothetical protein